jgi:hypothetical protein
MPIKIRSRKNKGKRLQNFTAERISKLLDIPWGIDKDIESRMMGCGGTDVILRGEAIKKFPYSIENKNCEKWNNILQWIEQAKYNQKKGTDWMLICKKNRMEPVVILDMEVFFKLYERILKG